MGYRLGNIYNDDDYIDDEFDKDDPKRFTENPRGFKIPKSKEVRRSNELYHFTEEVAVRQFITALPKKVQDVWMKKMFDKFSKAPVMNEKYRRAKEEYKGEANIPFAVELDLIDEFIKHNKATDPKFENLTTSMMWMHLDIDTFETLKDEKIDTKLVYTM